MARPSKEAGEKRNNRMTIYFTSAEEEQLSAMTEYLKQDKAKFVVGAIKAAIEGMPSSSGSLTIARRVAATMMKGSAVLIDPRGICHEGRFNDGKWSGRVSYVDEQGRRYDGTWENGLRKGDFSISYNGTDVYNCEWEDGKPDYDGSYAGSDGGKYHGEWEKGKPNGKGVYTWPNGDRYEGTWVDGKPDKIGVYTWPNGDKYEGNWGDGKRHGQGILTWANGDRYEGEWIQGKRHGQGVFTDSKGSKYDGSWLDGQPDGHGIYCKGRILKERFKNPERHYELMECFEGAWVKGEFKGAGRFNNSEILYIGDFADGKPNGNGTYTDKKGNRGEGVWKDGRFSGQGVFTDDSGLRFEGEFIDSKPTDNGSFFREDSKCKQTNYYLTQFYGQKELKFNVSYRLHRDAWSCMVSAKTEEGNCSPCFLSSKDYFATVIRMHGVYVDAEGTCWEGTFKDGRWTGKGTYINDNGDLFEGDYKNGKRSGQGVETYANGARYEGGWFQNKWDGEGTYTDDRGRAYRGRWNNSGRHEKGIFMSANGDIYVGDMRVGTFGSVKPSGKGTIKYADGTVFRGKWDNGKRSGTGKHYAADGTVIRHGVYKKDVFIRCASEKKSSVEAPAISADEIFEKDLSAMNKALKRKPRS